ncbi:hypothetical protein MSAN_01025000 [Mycena sanguinolenta]|uniref:Secreted protein n=1 Tax=Mycena sanguinolenta TaxID=230812 RepID=A0A8H6YRV4_9AGAR|nr:hypothetical protein MSAN_01025000 [Mycena sanguinolenta]
MILSALGSFVFVFIECDPHQCTTSRRIKLGHMKIWLHCHRLTKYDINVQRKRSSATPTQKKSPTNQALLIWFTIIMASSPRPFASCAIPHKPKRCLEPSSKTAAESSANVLDVS